jgi:hypothetical protein
MVGVSSRRDVRLDLAHTGQSTAIKTPGKLRPIEMVFDLSDALSYNLKKVNRT